MKNIFRTLAIVALGFFATSCVSADVDEVQMASGDGVVNFTLAAPQHNSRVIADGKSATDLTCAVYDANWNYLTTVKGEFTGGALTTTVSIRLVNAKTYNFVFWAEVPGNTHYTKNFGTTPGEQVLEPNITVNYNSGVAGDANDETRDAFFGKLLNLTINGTMNEYVPLKRPFAQINFGTLDTEAAKVGGFDITTATVSKFTTRAYTTLNLANGEATDEVDVEFTDNELPVEDLYLMADTQKTTPYNWLAMNYILWPETEGSLSTCTMVITDNDATPESVEIKYPNAPVRRNWRTNLVGNLLTDNVIIEVEILPIPENEYNVDVPETVYATVPDNNTEDVVLNSESVAVSVPASSATAGDIYKMVVSNESVETDTATGETTVAFDLTLYKNDQKVSGTTVYEVTKKIGTGKIIAEVTHNGTVLTNATTGADQTYTYDSATGVLTIYTASFSPFTVTYIELKETFADNSWGNIILACQSDSVPASWNVGNKKEMTIGNSAYDVAIIGKNHDVYSDGTGMAPLTFQLTEVYGSAAMNATQTNATGWSGSKMRNTTMVEALAAMPIEVQNAVKAVDKLTLKGDASGLETTSDKLFLLSLFECYGSTFYSNGYEEGSKYEYYSSIDKRIMNATWWLRGPGVNNGKNNGIGFTQINMSGYMANGSAEYASGVIFGFCF